MVGLHLIESLVVYVFRIVNQDLEVKSDSTHGVDVAFDEITFFWFEY